ncbi:hypothetical protein SD81_022385 [Tolypothrix campylonemoides VB511288]|nr:hypothetical protein SD81_022385 [Tolypothrix campylonemoides VB511288]
MADENSNSGNQSNTDLGNVLQQSPWGRLINEVTSAETVLEGFGNATGGGSTGSAPSGAGGGNPFTNFGNPNAEGSPLTGGTNPWAAINSSGSNAPSDSGSTDVLTGASSGVNTSVGGSSNVSSGGGSSQGGGFGGGSQGGIDFGSATESSSFQNRILIDQFIAAGPTEESTEELSSQITDSIVNQVSSLGSTSSVDGGSDTQFGGGGNLNAGTDTQFGGGGTQFGGGSIPFA